VLPHPWKAATGHIRAPELDDLADPQKARMTRLLEFEQLERTIGES
jgi:hypothetical protein